VSHSKTIIQAELAPAATGPYSQAVGYGGLLFTGGQVGEHPDDGVLIRGGVESQARQALRNLSMVLEAAGLDLTHALKATVFLKNLADAEVIDRVFSEFFDENPPARELVEVSRLRKDGLVEVSIVAASPPPEVEAGPDEQAPTPVVAPVGEEE
jgi:2-iminobutanoate/2-iminopropanoate deaminase